MSSIQILISVGIAVGVAAAWTIALVAAGTLFRRDQARAAKSLRPITIPGQHPTETDDTRELVLR